MAETAEQAKAGTTEHGAAAPNQASAPRQDAPGATESTQEDGAWIGLLEHLDGFVYGVVGLAFLIAALFSLGIGLYAAGDQVLKQMFLPTGFSLSGLTQNGTGAQDVIALVSDLLLTLIIMEVLGTVIHHLRERETTLRPFLFIGIISATRGILAVGARLTITSGTPLGDNEFIHDMVELGVNAAVIIALGITMRLIGDLLDQGATQGRTRRKKPTPLALRIDQGLVMRTIIATMVLIVLVALTLVAVLLATGRL